MNEVMNTNPAEQMQLAAAGANSSVVAIESKRAVAEVLGQIQVAKSFPRNMQNAIAELRDACRSSEFAKTAFYSVPNRGSGPSIRFAEEAARCYGNFVYGHKELERREGRSLVEVYAWDVERNNRSTRQITVEHVMDSRNGPRKLTDQADIDNRIANVASKQMRGRIMALLPKALVQIGIEEARRTIAGENVGSRTERTQRMVDAFNTKYGVPQAHLAAYIGHSLDTVTEEEFVDLLGVFNALKEGAKVSDYFDLTTVTEDAAGAAVNAALNKPAATPTPAATQQRTTRRTTATAKPAQDSTQAEAPEDKPAAQAAPKQSPAPAAAPAPERRQAPEPDPDMGEIPPPDDDDGIPPPEEKDLF